MAEVPHAVQARPDLGSAARSGGGRRAWMPVWSKPAALRALRATLVVPGLFALAHHGIGDFQMALFASFGGFATLVLASFGGRRRDKLVAHAGLAVAGSLLVIIGTAVNASVLAVTLVTVVVVFVVLFAGICGPNAASGGTAALLAYVLPAASPGTLDMLPSRLEGWWMASIAGTAAVLLLSPRSSGAQLQKAVAASARALATQLEASLHGDTAVIYREATIAAKQELLTRFTATPYRPTGLAAADQALDNLVGLLEWAVDAVCQSLREYHDFSGFVEGERRLLADTAVVLGNVAALLDGEAAQSELDRLERSLATNAEYLHRLGADSDDYREAVHLSFHARTVAVAAHTAMADALIVAHRADPKILSGRHRRWYGVILGEYQEDASFSERHLPALATVTNLVSRNASLRSVWFLNSARGALALAAAVAVADLSGVDHGFWVVLGTLSVLRTNAAATGATVLRALLGTVAGFAIGALLLAVIGSSSAALWTALPIAVLVAAYAPGVLPFAVGQAAFTVTVSVLFNLLVPVGWQIGVVRVEDVAMGCAVSVAVGALFWPRGAGGLVGDDLADAFRTGGSYLAAAANWALGFRQDAPAASASITAAVRLNDALRGYLTEQGAKVVPKEKLWRLVSGTIRARLTAHSLAGLPNPHVEADSFRSALSDQASQVAAWYDHLASRLDRTDHGDLPMLAPPEFRDPMADGASILDLSCALWVHEHLLHLAARLGELVEPAQAVAAQRHRPWWR